MVSLHHTNLAEDIREPLHGLQYKFAGTYTVEDRKATIVFLVASMPLDCTTRSEAARTNVHFVPRKQIL
eukprot:639705-Rhodomonas_salina.3